MVTQPGRPALPRVLQVVRSLDLAGGVESVAFELQRAWRRGGVDSRVLTVSAADTVDPQEVDPVAPWLQRLPIRGRGRYLGLLLAVPLFTVLATSRQRRAGRGRVVLSHGDTLGGDVCVIHAVNAASLAEKRQAGKWLWRLNPMHAWVGLRDRYAIGRLRFRRYVAPSERVASELQALYGVPRSRIVLIPNGVDTARYAPAPGLRAAVRREFGIPEDAPLLLFVGHEFGRKGLSYVIGALPKLPADTHLLVVGSDNAAPYQALAAAEGLAPGRVVFAGVRRDLHRIYPAGDAFVFPTYYEAFGLVCMEAMSCGLPLFATRAGGIEDYLRDGENGAFIERDAATVAARLRPVLLDPALRARMGAAARRTAEAYSWARIAQRYLDLLQSLHEPATEAADVHLA